MKIKNLFNIYVFTFFGGTLGIPLAGSFFSFNFLFTIFLSVFIIYKRPKVYIDKTLKLFLLFILLSPIGYLNNFIENSFMNLIKQEIVLLGAFLVILNINNDYFKVDFDVAFKFTSVYLLIIVFFEILYNLDIIPFIYDTMIQIKPQFAIEHDPEFRLEGMWREPSHHTNIFLILFAYWFSYFLRYKKRKYLIFALLSFIVIVLGSSRGGTIGVMGMLFVFFLIYLKENIKRKRILYLLPLSLILGAVGIYFLSFNLRNLSSDYFDKISSNMTRLNELETGIMIFDQHKIFGVGTGLYSTHYPKYYRSATFVTDHNHAWAKLGKDSDISSDNFLIRLLSENGVVGFIVMACFFLITTKYAYENYKYNKKYLFHIMALFGIYFSWVGFSAYDMYHWWFLSAIIIKENIIIRKKLKII